MLRRISLIIVPLAAISLLIVPTRTVLADQPSIQKISFDSGQVVAPVLSRRCGFTVFREDVLNQTVFTYADGSTKTVGGPSYTTFFGPGGTLTAQLAGAYKVTNNPDGTTTIAETGNASLLVVPGVGPVRGAAGRFVMVLDQDGNVISVTQTGAQPGTNFAAICSYLAG